MICFYAIRIFLLVFISLTALRGMEEREHKKQSLTFHAGGYEMQGKRPAMQDAVLMQIPFKRSQPSSALFAIFDGHGTDAVAKFAATNISRILRSIDGNFYTMLNTGIPKLDKKMQSMGTASFAHGTCAIVALLDENNLAVANVGDSRAVLSRLNEAYALSEDQKPNREDEKARITAIRDPFGFYYEVNNNRVCRLNISRALGDFYAKRDGVIINTPEIHETTLMPGDDFLILACDGIFEQEEINRQDAVDIVKTSLKCNNNDPNLAARDLVQEAFKRGSQDNLSAIVITFAYDSNLDNKSNN